MKNKSKSPYEPQGYEPRRINPEELKKSDLAYQIMEKQRRNQD